MKIKSETYPNKIRRIAEDLSKKQHLYNVKSSVIKLRLIADELEQNLKKTMTKKI